MNKTVKDNYNKFIELTKFNLPLNKNELSLAEDIIKKLKYNINSVCTQNNITDKLHDWYFEEVTKVLIYVGKLSEPAFEIFNDLEIIYHFKFPKSPKLSKQLWLEHYQKIHQPYNILKNRCFALLDELDNAYLEKYKTNPPNWKL